MNHRNQETLDRMQAMVVRRLQTAGADGMNVSDLAPMIQAEHGGTMDYCRNVLIRMFQSAKIFRKIVPQEKGGIGARYFLQEDWATNYEGHLVKRSKQKDAATLPEQTIPKYSVTERDPQPFEFGEGIIVPAHVKVKVCDPYKSDYRITVDPASIPRHVDSSQCRDWAKA